MLHTKSLFEYQTLFMEYRGVYGCFCRWILFVLLKLVTYWTVPIQAHHRLSASCGMKLDLKKREFDPQKIDLGKVS